MRESDLLDLLTEQAAAARDQLLAEREFDAARQRCNAVYERLAATPTRELWRFSYRLARRARRELGDACRDHPYAAVLAATPARFIRYYGARGFWMPFGMHALELACIRGIDRLDSFDRLCIELPRWRRWKLSTARVDGRFPGERLMPSPLPDRRARTP